ncbi:TlpA family protein disulfide reductase [Desulfolutivibrio sp.]|uniref:TlpA family protein disulfide reductase n=1 Tax=Desulfolutivibrio sp. TaxID=2773296 RepID=UPI002F964CC2
MRIITCAAVAFFLTLACLGPAPALAKNDMAISAGQLVDRISQSRGKFVVINFWASWCRPCQQEIPELITLRRDIPESDLVLLGISVDQNPGDFFRFIKQMPFNYPVFVGGADVAGLFAVGSIPKMVVFNRDGEMIHTSEGYMSGDELRELLSLPGGGGGV